MGRRKIEMKMVKDSSSRQVTFSKRRTGLFKKANELVTLCGAEVVVVVFSPGGKPFSFGHPSVDAVARRFLNDDESTDSEVPDDGGRIENMNDQLNELNRQIAAEKQRGEMLDKAMRDSGVTKFLNAVNKLNKKELMDLKAIVDDVRGQQVQRMNELEASVSLLMLAKQQPAN